MVGQPHTIQHSKKLVKDIFDLFEECSKKQAALFSNESDFAAGIPIQISVYNDKLYISNDCVFPDTWTAETLKQKHRSLPHNPDIANTFFRAGFIESWGRGIEKICTLCKNYGIPEPEYTVHPGDIMLKFNSNITENTYSNEDSNNESGLKSSLKSSLKSGLKSGLKSDQSIIEAIIANPNVTIPVLQEKTGLSRNGVKKALTRLKEQGIVRRIGPDKGGHWELLQQS